jgi:hypothetical protein
MAKLYFYYASMNAGKSSTLLQADFNYRERGMRTMLWTAQIDDRSEGMVRSRIGLEADAHRYTAETDLHGAVIAAHRTEPLDCVLIDEAQFLTRDQVWQCARLADEAGIPVVCYAVSRLGSAARDRRQARGAQGRVPLRAQGDDESAGRCQRRGGQGRRADRGRRQRPLCRAVPPPLLRGARAHYIEPACQKPSSSRCFSSPA